MKFNPGVIGGIGLTLTRRWNQSNCTVRPTAAMVSSTFYANRGVSSIFLLAGHVCTNARTAPRLEFVRHASWSSCGPLIRWEILPVRFRQRRRAV
jgi:hypothetical protein